MNHASLAGLALLSFGLAGCGDGGGSVASTPDPIMGVASSPPVSHTITIGAELPATPATTPGTYTALASASLAGSGSSSGLVATSVAPGDLTIAVGADGRSYTLSFNPAAIPYPGSGTVGYVIDDPGFNHQRTDTTRFADGTANVQTFQGTTGIANTTNSTFWSLKGQSYVSLGRWSWLRTPPAGGTGGLLADLYFVFGDRTPAAAIPTSGTATYVSGPNDFLEWHAIAYDLGDVNIKLTADFGKRSIGADVSLDYPGPNGNEVAPKLDGTGTIVADGSFGIPLNGVYNSKDPQSGPMSGSIAGAMFGPAAEQVGATLTLLHGTDDPIVAAFTGVRP